MSMDGAIMNDANQNPAPENGKENDFCAQHNFCDTI
jgi:hypothetical protein